MAEQDFFVFNGVDKETGELWAPPLVDASERVLLKALAPWIDRNDLAQCGWGLIFAKNDPQAAQIREALSPLIEHRRASASGNVVELEFVPNMDVPAFRRRYKDLYTVGNARRAPYYLLIAGDPRFIPFSFQSDLAASHAVGRLHFPKIEQYFLYANLVVAEEKLPSRARRAVFWAADHENDPASRLTTKVLTGPVAQALRSNPLGFAVDTFVGAQATKRNLSSCLGSAAPAILFTSGHGLYLKAGNQDQLPEQGSLICSDWPGPGTGGVKADHYFSAADLHGPGPRGLISFHFACNSAGTPELDNFYFHDDPKNRPRLAEYPFVSALSQAMLGSAGGGSLAFVGHVDRTWITTFLWRDYDGEPDIYTTVIEALLRGCRLGWALSLFSHVSAEISNDFIRKILEHVGPYDPKMESAHLLGQIGDLQGFVILGDPAVKLSAVAGPGGLAAEPP